jgi:hypothetical protein
MAQNTANQGMSVGLPAGAITAPQQQAIADLQLRIFNTTITLPQFSGKGSEFDQWEKSIRAIMVLMDKDDVTHVYSGCNAASLPSAIVSSTCGSANEWILSSQRDSAHIKFLRERKFDLFLEAARKKFVTGSTMIELGQELLALKCSIDPQDIVHYVERFEKLVKIMDDQLMNVIIRHLLFANLPTPVREKATIGVPSFDLHENVATIRRLVTSTDYAEWVSAQQASQRTSSADPTSIAAVHNQHARSPSTSSSNSAYNPNVFCSYCKRKGHSIQKCRKKSAADKGKKEKNGNHSHANNLEVAIDSIGSSGDKTPVYTTRRELSALVDTSADISSRIAT